MMKVIVLIIFNLFIFAFSQLLFSREMVESYFGFNISVCNMQDVGNLSESEVEKCIDYLEGESVEKYKSFTLKALDFGFGYPAVIINYTDLFEVSDSIKIPALYKAAYSCYKPSYNMIFNVEIKNDNPEAILWALLIFQNSEKYEGLEPHRGITKRVSDFIDKEKIESIKVKDLLSFFDRFDCMARN
ncbi:hypothetical protein [Pseudoalteromonas xiamenensis]